MVNVRIVALNVIFIQFLAHIQDAPKFTVEVHNRRLICLNVNIIASYKVSNHRITEVGVAEVITRITQNKCFELCDVEFIEQFSLKILLPVGVAGVQ